MIRLGFSATALLIACAPGNSRDLVSLTLEHQADQYPVAVIIIYDQDFLSHPNTMSLCSRLPEE
jgi:hypothetical protein